MNFFVYTASVLMKKKVKTVVTAAAIFRFSYSKFRRTADLAIAYWKKQIVLCPYNDNDKEWCKEFVETMVKKELGKLKMELKEVVAGQYWFKSWL